MLGCKYSLPRSHMDMKTSLGSWIPGSSQAHLQSKPFCGRWVWLFGSARPQRGAQGIPLTQPGPARRVRESWMGAWWPYFPTSPPQNHRQCTVLRGEGVSAPAQLWQSFPCRGAHPVPCPLQHRAAGRCSPHWGKSTIPLEARSHQRWLQGMLRDGAGKMGQELPM